MQIRFVGANCVRPLQFTKISDRQLAVFHTENKYRIYGLSIISVGEHSSPLHKKFHRIGVYTNSMIVICVRTFGLQHTPTGDQWSPLQITFIKLALN